MDIVLAHPTDPFVPVEGGAVRYMLSLLQYLCGQGHRVIFIGKHTGDQAQHEKRLDFVSVSKGSQNWLLYVVNLLIKTPFISLPENAVIQTGRLDCMLPFVLFKPANPKVMISDEPLRHYAKPKFGRLFPLVAAVYHVIESYCLRRMDFLVTEERTKEYYMHYHPELMTGRLYVMSHSPVDLKLFKPMNQMAAREEFGFGAQDRIIIFVGRLARVKRIDFLIRAFSLMKAQVDRAKLLIVGRGEEEKRLKEMVQDLSIIEDTVFAGEVNPARVPGILNCADVLALSSRGEGAPTVVKEALACGVPVVSVDVGDVRTILTSELVGRIVPADEHAFAQALIEVMEMAAQKPNEVQEACVAAAQPYSLEAFGERMVEIYEEALTRRGYATEDKGGSAWG